MANEPNQYKSLDRFFERSSAYAEGYKAGRASRDGLREALVQMFNDESGFAIPLLQIASKALYEDDKEAGNGK